MKGKRIDLLFKKAIDDCYLSFTSLVKFCIRNKGQTKRVLCSLQASGSFFFVFESATCICIFGVNL